MVLDGAIGIDFRTGQRFHEAVFEPMVAAATLDAFRSAHLDPCIYIEDPDVDIVLSDSPATCRAHLRDIRSVSGVVDLDTVVRTRAVYGFSVLGVARDRLEPVCGLLVQLGVQVQFNAVPGYGEHGLLASQPSGRSGPVGALVTGARRSFAAPHRDDLAGTDARHPHAPAVDGAAAVLKGEEGGELSIGLVGVSALDRLDCAVSELDLEGGHAVEDTALALLGGRGGTCG